MGFEQNNDGDLRIKNKGLKQWMHCHDMGLSETDVPQDMMVDNLFSHWMAI